MLKEIFLSGFIGAIFLRSFFDPGISFSFLILLASFLIISAEYFYERFLGKVVNLKLIAFLFFSFSLGLGWYDFRVRDVSESLIVENDGTVSVVGVIIEEPEEKETGTNLVVRAELNGIEEKILVKTGNFPKYKYGDEIKIWGEVKKPKNFDETFDYVSYLSKEGIHFVTDSPKMALISSERGSWLKRKLFEMKNAFVESGKEAFSEPQSSLLAGLLIGAKESLGKDWLEKFRIVGLSHVVVLSGYNLTIISDMVMRAISFVFSRNASIGLGSLSIILFSIMTGGGASTVRAAIMALIVLLSRATGRMYEAAHALILAGFLMVLHNPKILVFDMSFQLSFLATLGLIYISPLVKGKISFIPEKFQLRELVSATIGAQLATTPLIVYKMGTFSIVALPANLLVLIFKPLTMLFGFFAVVFNFINFWIALPLVGLAWALLSYELFVVDVFSSLSFASVNITFVQFSILIVLILALYLVYDYFSKAEDSPNVVRLSDGWVVEEVKNDS